MSRPLSPFMQHEMRRVEAMTADLDAQFARQDAHRRLVETAKVDAAAAKQIVALEMAA